MTYWLNRRGMKWHLGMAMNGVNVVGASWVKGQPHREHHFIQENETYLWTARMTYLPYGQYLKQLQLLYLQDAPECYDRVLDLVLSRLFYLFADFEQVLFPVDHR